MRGDALQEEIEVFAPATVGNVGPGFDLLGLAIEGPGDRVRARLLREPRVQIVQIIGDGGQLPREASRNTAGIAALEVLRLAAWPGGLQIELEKGLPIGSGLGSSCASAVAGALAANLLIGSPLSEQELMLCCVEAEAAVSGRHADNVAPCLLGGLVLVESLESGSIRTLRLPVPSGLYLAVVSPDFCLSTRAARAALPSEVPLAERTLAAARLASFVSACFLGELELLSRSMKDELVNDARAPLIPGCAQALRTALDLGALGSSISGAGPSVFALCRDREQASLVGQAMALAFEGAGLASRVRISPMQCAGARRT